MTTDATLNPIPRDAFETQLFRREIERQFAWTHDGLPLRIGIGETTDGAGRLAVTLMLEPQSFDARRYAQDNRRVTGTCWLTASSHGEPLARWHLPAQPMVAAAQENDAHHSPMVDWN